VDSQLSVGLGAERGIILLRVDCWVSYSEGDSTTGPTAEAQLGDAREMSERSMLA